MREREKDREKEQINGNDMKSLRSKKWNYFLRTKNELAGTTLRTIGALIMKAPDLTASFR